MLDRRCLGMCREDGLAACHIAHTKQEDAIERPTPRLVRDSDEQRAVHGWLFTRGDEHRRGRFSRQPVPTGDYTDARRGGGEVEVLQYMGLEHSVQKGSDLYAAMILLPTNTRCFSVWYAPAILLLSLLFYRAHKQMAQRQAPSVEDVRIIEDDDPKYHHHRKRRRGILGIPFWFCCCCAAVLGAVVIIGFVISLVSYEDAKRLAAPVAPIPPPPCNYSEWSQWSFQCFVLFNESLGQIRTQNADPPWDYCPQLLETQPCDVFLSLLDTFITYNFTCSYDFFTHLCTSSHWLRDTFFYPSTNATDLELYHTQAPFTGYRALGVTMFGCIPECPISDEPIVPVPSSSTPTAACTYYDWAPWSFQCVEYPPGVYSQLRVKQANPPTPSCTDILEQGPCNATLCTPMNITEIDTLCFYNLITAACTSTSIITTTITLCSNNASDLTAFSHSQDWPSVSIPTINLPCSPLCASSNGQIPHPPQPQLCVYSEWGSWSFQCFEAGPGDYRQYRNQTSITFTGCAPHVEYRSCNTASPECTTYDNANSTNTCFYNASNDCVSSSVHTVHHIYCAISGVTDIALYEATVTPSGFTSTTLESPCVAACPPTNPDPIIIVPSFTQTMNLSAGLRCLPPNYVVNDECTPCFSTSLCTVGVLNPQANTCLQAPACDDQDLCTDDLCNATTGECTYIPKAHNLENANISVIYTCDSATGTVTGAPVVNYTQGYIMTCDDGDPLTIDSYSHVVQRCIHTVQAVSNNTLNVTACVAPIIPELPIQVTTIVDNHTVCTQFDRYCVASQCVAFGTPAPSPSPPPPPYCRHKVANYLFGAFLFYSTLNDDSLCSAFSPPPIYDRPTVLCDPTCCPDSRTGCANCDVLTTLGVLVTNPCGGCFCCTQNFHCKDGYYCNGAGNCLPLP